MAKSNPRAYRVADQIQRELADIIRSEVRDPRLPALVTISAVNVSRDLAVATIFITLVDAAEQSVAIEVLNRAIGFLRTELARRMKLRSVPQLKFKYDDSIERGQQMDLLIKQAIDSDQ